MTDFRFPGEPYDISEYCAERRIDGDYHVLSTPGSELDAAIFGGDEKKKHDADGLVRECLNGLRAAAVAIQDLECARLRTAVDARPTPSNVFELIRTDVKFMKDLQAARRFMHARVFVYAENYVRAIVAIHTHLRTLDAEIGCDKFRVKVEEYSDFLGVARAIRDSIEHRDERMMQRARRKPFTPGPLGKEITGDGAKLDQRIPVLSTGSIWGDKYSVTIETGENVSIPLTRDHLNEARTRVEAALGALLWESRPGPQDHYV